MIQKDSFKVPSNCRMSLDLGSPELLGNQATARERRKTLECLGC